MKLWTGYQIIENRGGVPSVRCSVNCIHYGKSNSIARNFILQGNFFDFYIELGIIDTYNATVKSSKARSEMARFPGFEVHSEWKKFSG